MRNLLKNETSWQLDADSASSHSLNPHFKGRTECELPLRSNSHLFYDLKALKVYQMCGKSLFCAVEEKYQFLCWNFHLDTDKSLAICWRKRVLDYQWGFISYFLHSEWIILSILVVVPELSSFICTKSIFWQNKKNIGLHIEIILSLEGICVMAADLYPKFKEMSLIAIWQSNYSVKY